MSTQRTDERCPDCLRPLDGQNCRAGGVHDLPSSNDESVVDWEKEFDKKFVVDEGSVELKENGEMGWAVDTRLIADYIDGKTLTGKHIKDFIASLLLKTRTAEQERVVGIVEKLEGPWKEEPMYQYGYDKAKEDIIEAIRGNEGKV